MSLVAEFVDIFGVWEEARPYVAMVVDEPEMALVVAMRGQLVTAEEAAAMLGIAAADAVALMDRAYSRCLLDMRTVGEATTYSATDFYARLDHFAKFENWDDIPAADRRAIDRRFLDEFIGRHRASVERKMQGMEAENSLPNDTVLLIGEVEEMLDASEHIAVQPCDCRRLGQFCQWPVDTCIALNEGALKLLDRGHGQRLTRDEAKELVRWADRQGLMHTGDSEWRTRGLHAICNCCSCDCYPFRAGQILGSKGFWPRSQYVAAHDSAACNLCGACIRRCHFGAFHSSGTVVSADGKAKPDVVFDAERCWGCGLCANTCPTNAISMVRIA